MDFYNKYKYYIILILVFGVLVYIELTKPRPIDWRESYSGMHKRPYGSYILKNELKNAFPEKKISENKQSYYQFFKNSRKTSILFITNYFYPSKLDFEHLLNHVEKGNSIFISASDFDKKFSDTLGFEVDASISWYDLNDTIRFQLFNPIFEKKDFLYKRAFQSNFFNKLDTLRSTALGKNSYGINFIKIKHGKGEFFIHLSPLSFTNYNFLVEKNFDYAFNALSYLSYNEIVWDEYYKPENSIYNKRTPIYFILETESLRWAWYILIVGLILYILFMGKRMQRIIPVIKPPKNSSLEFIETIGKLYYHKAMHKDLAEKKFKYFLDFLRTRYFIQNPDFSIKQINYIAQKTGVKQKTVERIFNQYRHIASKISISEQELFDLNKAIEEFYKKC